DGFLEPDRPWRFEPPLLPAPTAAPRLGEHTDTQPVGGTRHEPTDRPTGSGAAAAEKLPFAGLRVLDLTSFWAGPLATHLLAMQGAEVIHVESTARPDGTRLLAGLRFSEPDWWERSGIFTGLNANKLGVTLDLSKDEGRAVLRRLLATCDVV